MVGISGSINSHGRYYLKTPTSRFFTHKFEAAKHHRELREARCFVTGWLEENRFPAGDPNGKKGATWKNQGFFDAKRFIGYLVLMGSFGWVVVD